MHSVHNAWKKRTICENKRKEPSRNDLWFSFQQTIITEQISSKNHLPELFTIVAEFLNFPVISKLELQLSQKFFRMKSSRNNFFLEKREHQLFPSFKIDK
jgi:hypothetical protein